MTVYGRHVALMFVIRQLLYGPRPRIDQNTTDLTDLGRHIRRLHPSHGRGEPSGTRPFIDIIKPGYVTTLRNSIGLNVMHLGVYLCRIIATPAVTELIPRQNRHARRPPQLG
ncbi:MAG: hypothetical protein ACJ74U_15100 [Jatrophihabitantaceae bacterium]